MIPGPFAADYQSTFAKTFMSFAISQDPNTKFGTAGKVALPSWPKYVAGNGKEEVFGQVSATAGSIQPLDVDAGVRQHCQ